MKLVHQETQNCKLGFEIEKISELRNFVSYENFLIFPNFVPHFHHDANGLKQNLQHKCCIPPQIIKI